MLNFLCKALVNYQIPVPLIFRMHIQMIKTRIVLFIFFSKNARYCSKGYKMPYPVFFFNVTAKKETHYPKNDIFQGYNNMKGDKIVKTLEKKP
jgi:hypothetical protein